MFVSFKVEGSLLSPSCQWMGIVMVTMCEVHGDVDSLRVQELGSPWLGSKLVHHGPEGETVEVVWKASWRYLSAMEIRFVATCVKSHCPPLVLRHVPPCIRASQPHLHENTPSSSSMYPPPLRCAKNSLLTLTTHPPWSTILGLGHRRPYSEIPKVVPDSI